MKRTIAITAVLSIFAFMSLGANAWAIPTEGEGGGEGSLHCYSLKKETKIDPVVLDLMDQFTDRTGVKVKNRADMLCTDAYITEPFEDGEPSPETSVAPSEADMSLVCYKVQKEKSKNVVNVYNELGDQSFKTDKAELICVRSYTFSDDPR